MNATAKGLATLKSSPAPDHWAEIPEIAAEKPNTAGKDMEKSLQRFEGTNFCQWHTRSGSLWQPKGDVFIVIEA